MSSIREAKVKVQSQDLDVWKIDFIEVEYDCLVVHWQTGWRVVYKQISEMMLDGLLGKGVVNAKK